jgi:hypothetical protein
VLNFEPNLSWGGAAAVGLSVARVQVGVEAALSSGSLLGIAVRDLSAAAVARVKLVSVERWSLRAQASGGVLWRAGFRGSENPSYFFGWGAVGVENAVRISVFELTFTPGVRFAGDTTIEIGTATAARLTGLSPQILLGIRWTSKPEVSP